MPAPSFESIRDILQRHLPRAAVGSPVSIDGDGIHVVDPGVSIGDLARMIEDLTGAADFLPENLPVADIRLQTLELSRPAGEGADLTFTVLWDNISLAVVENFPLKLAKVDFSLRAGWLRAVAEAKFAIDDYELDVTFEFPSQVLELRLDPEQLPSGTDGFLAGRGLVAKGGGAKVRELVVRGSLLFQRVMVYVELEDLFTIGPVTLSAATAEVVLAGDGDSSAAASAEIRVAVENHLDLVIDVAGEVDQQGWRVAGSLEMAKGGFSIGDLAASLAKHLNQSAPQLPDAISKLGLARLAVALDTHDESFNVDCTLDWAHSAELVVHLEKSGGQLLVTGSLALGEVVFKVAFKAGTTALFSYEAAGSKPLKLDQILAALSVDSTAALGPGGTGISLNIRSAAVALDAQKEVLIAAEVDAGIDLSRLGKLPLVGSLLPAGEPLGLSISPYYMGDKFAAEAEVRPLLPASLALPDPLSAGIHVAGALHLGGKPISMDLKLADSPASAQPPATAQPVTAAAPVSDVTWTQVNKKLGPLTIARVGHATDKATFLDLELDASLEIAGLTVSVNGLGVRYSFKTRDLQVRLRGLGLDLKRPPMEIGGAFMNADGDFLGKVVISTEKFALNAIGGFKMLDGVPSMFAYGVLDMPLGGPAFFYVEGLAAGFGLHRRLHMPRIEDVRTFPLVANAGVKTASTPKPDAEFGKLHDYISPQLGEYFFAAGIKFNSFRLLHGFALLVVSVGRDLEVDLIGTADFASPPDLPEGVPAMASIELDLIARIAPGEGLIAVEARLNPKSYVYGPLCHLSGGFAFYAWTKGAHNGDFVLSVGGYHPEYTRPEHYPIVPRVELKYQVSSEIYLKGDAYFALTPSIMMAGGGLHADMRSGSLHAWADLTVDFWVAWEPFHYDARVHIGIGAQWKCFHTSASADLHIWGPEFSGTAHVDWCIFSFDLDFGPHSPAVPLPISLAKFKKSFLGVTGDTETANATLGVILAKGVVGEVDGMPVVSPADLIVSTSSRVPAKTASLFGQFDLKVSNPELKLGVTPAGVEAIQVSNHVVKVERDKMDVSEEFAAVSLETGFPAALWAPSIWADANALPISAVSGIELRPSGLPEPGQSMEKRVDKLTYVLTLRAVREVVTEVRSAGPMAVSLPNADLDKLGLHPEALTFVSKPIRPTIQLGGWKGDAIA
ncbi:MAG: DUF6603 domain-containing protein [Aestuariivirga sp.]